MIELIGTLKERLNEAIRLSYTDVTQEELEHFRSVYEQAKIELLPSAVEFYKQYGGVFRNYHLVVSKPEYNHDVYLAFYTDSQYEEENIYRMLEGVMDSDFFDSVKSVAKQNVCPVAQIGYYYPADVYIGENGLLYCLYEFQEQIEFFNTPSEILESYLKNNIPVGIEERFVDNHHGE